MPARTDAEELQALQQKAYGRGGRLTAAESQRLRELEDARRPSVAASAPADVGPADTAASEEGDTPAGDAAPVAAADVSSAPGAPGAPAAPMIPDEPATLGAALRQHVVSVIVAAAVMLTIGVAAGWALSAPGTGSFPLTSEEQQRRAELSAATFDPGSVRAVAKTDDALVWYATRDAGAALCMILDVGEQTQTECLPPDEIERGLTAALSLPSEGAGDDELFDDGSFDGETVIARLLLSVDGEPIAGIQLWGGSTSLAAQFPEDVRDRATQLIADGFDFGLSLVSTVRGAPVWLADRLSAQGATERCLIVDAGGPAACAPFEAAVREGLATQLVDVDPRTGTASVTVLDLRFTSQQTAYLAVTEGATTVSVVTPGESFIVQTPPGDPIEVRAPGEGTGG